MPKKKKDKFDFPKEAVLIKGGKINGAIGFGRAKDFRRKKNGRL